MSITKARLLDSTNGRSHLPVFSRLSTKLGRLREILDAKKEDIDLLKPRAKKANQQYSNNAVKAEKQKAERARKMKIPSENYGFVSMMDAAQGTAPSAPLSPLSAHD